MTQVCQLYSNLLCQFYFILTLIYIIFKINIFYFLLFIFRNTKIDFKYSDYFEKNNYRKIYFIQNIKYFYLIM